MVKTETTEVTFCQGRGSLKMMYPIFKCNKFVIVGSLLPRAWYMVLVSSLH